MITLGFVYVLAGLTFALFAILGLQDRSNPKRFGNAAFWGLLALSMLAGFCGTLMTPMAANFNLVPAALLELKNPYGVIRAQIGTALPLLAVNILFIYLFAF